ncbi:MAG: 3',5'-cyclic-nucleotide phosphodiesterase pde1 [Chaenotheca gracillima]|nr:MAG: 3',5'-cyclic-nucleotide phosphodiesterase pde1 [Chaenotheca gracillima]
MTTFASLPNPATHLSYPEDDMDLFTDEMVEDPVPDLDVMEEDIFDDDIMVDEDGASHTMGDDIQIQNEVPEEDMDANTTGTAGSPIAHMSDAVDFAIEAYPVAQAFDHTEQKSHINTDHVQAASEPEQSQALRDVVEDSQQQGPEAHIGEQAADSAPDHNSDRDVSRVATSGSPPLPAVETNKGTTEHYETSGISQDEHQNETSEKVGGSSESTQFPCPIIITYDGSEMSLFPLLGDESAGSFLLQDANLAVGSIDELFKEMRQVLEGTLPENEDLELAVEDLELSLSEDCANVQNMSLSQIIDLHTQLYRQDGYEIPDPLYISLSTKPGFASKFKELTSFANTGKGISQLPRFLVEEDHDDDTRATETDVAASNGETALAQNVEPVENSNENAIRGDPEEDFVLDVNPTEEEHQFSEQDDRQIVRGSDETQTVNIDNAGTSGDGRADSETKPSADAQRNPVEITADGQGLEEEDLIDYNDNEEELVVNEEGSVAKLQASDDAGLDREQEEDTQALHGTEPTQTSSDVPGEGQDPLHEISYDEADEDNRAVAHNNVDDAHLGLGESEAPSHEISYVETDEYDQAVAHGNVDDAHPGQEEYAPEFAENGTDEINYDDEVEDEASFDQDGDWQYGDESAAEPRAEENDEEHTEALQAQEGDESYYQDAEESLGNEVEQDEIDYESHDDEVEPAEEVDDTSHPEANGHEDLGDRPEVTEHVHQKSFQEGNGTDSKPKDSANSDENTTADFDEINYDDDDFDLEDPPFPEEDFGLEDIETGDKSLKRTRISHEDENPAQGESQEAKRIRSD